MKVLLGRTCHLHCVVTSIPVCHISAPMSERWKLILVSDLMMSVELSFPSKLDFQLRFCQGVFHTCFFSKDSVLIAIYHTKCSVSIHYQMVLKVQKGSYRFSSLFLLARKICNENFVDALGILVAFRKASRKHNRDCYSILVMQVRLKLQKFLKCSNYLYYVIGT